MPTPTPAPATRFRENLGSDSFHTLARAQLHSARAQATATEVREENGERLVSCITFARAQAPTTEIEKKLGRDSFLAIYRVA